MVSAVAGGAVCSMIKAGVNVRTPESRARRGIVGGDAGCDGSDWPAHAGACDVVHAGGALYYDTARTDLC